MTEAGLLPAEVASVVGRLGFCLWSSTALLYTAARFDLATAGYAVGLFTVTAAVLAAPLSLLYARSGRGGPVAAVLCVNPLSCLLVLGAGSANRPLLYAGVILAAASAPPTAAVMRSIWNTAVAAEDAVRMQSVESVLTQICLVVAPPTVGLLVASGWPSAAPIVAVVAVTAGAGAMVRTCSSISLGAGSATGAATGSARGAVGYRVLALFTIIIGTSVVSGVFNVSAAARFDTESASLATPGTVIGAAALGSIAGGLLYTRVRRRIAARWRYPILAAVWAGALWLLAVAPTPGAALAASAVSGLPIGGLGAEEFGAVGRVSRRKSTMMYGLANTFVSAGVGLGAVGGAHLITGTVAATVLPAVVATIVLAVSVALWPMIGTGER